MTPEAVITAERVKELRESAVWDTSPRIAGDELALLLDAYEQNAALKRQVDALKDVVNGYPPLLDALREENEKLRRMIIRLGSHTHDYLSARTNGEEPPATVHEELAAMAYDYAFHTDETVKAEQSETAMEF